MGKTLLHTAVQLKDKKLLQMFINAGVYVDLADMNGNAPIHLAVTYNRLDIVRALRFVFDTILYLIIYYNLRLS